jgi:hypothetical protein|tara:strand:+ start:355 stop:513 length:159 start_codon:yes stop_codon:yes gene_type:complete
MARLIYAMTGFMRVQSLGVGDTHERRAEKGTFSHDLRCPLIIQSNGVNFTKT